MLPGSLSTAPLPEHWCCPPGPEPTPAAGTAPAVCRGGSRSPAVPSRAPASCSPGTSGAGLRTQQTPPETRTPVGSPSPFPPAPCSIPPWNSILLQPCCTGHSSSPEHALESYREFPSPPMSSGYWGGDARTSLYKSQSVNQNFSPCLPVQVGFYNSFFEVCL